MLRPTTAPNTLALASALALGLTSCQAAAPLETASIAADVQSLQVKADKGNEKSDDKSNDKGSDKNTDSDDKIAHHGKIEHGAFIPAAPVTAVAKFDPSKRRLRIDVAGDDDQHILSTIGSQVVGKDATGAPVPITWKLTKGSATLKILNPDGTTTDLLCNPTLFTGGCPALTTGPIVDPLTGELGVAIGHTSTFGTVGDIVELIWPNLSGGAVPPGPPIVRVQLASWAQVLPTSQGGQVVGETFHLEALDPTGTTYVWDWAGTNPDATPARLTIPTSPDGNTTAPGPLAVAPPPAGVLPPPVNKPVQLNINGASITQLRADNRLRIDMTAISPTRSPSLKDVGGLAAASPQGIKLTGEATVTVNGTTTSIINLPRTTTLVPQVATPLFAVPPTGELGLVIGPDPKLPGDFLELIWPTLTGGAVAGIDPIVRVQLGDWIFPTAKTPKLDVHFDIHSFTPDGATALTSWHGDALGVNVK